MTQKTSTGPMWWRGGGRKTNSVILCVCHDKDKATLGSRPSQEERKKKRMCPSVLHRQQGGGSHHQKLKTNSEDVNKKTGHYGT